MGKSVEVYEQEQGFIKEIDEVMAIGLVVSVSNSIPHFCHELST